MRFLPALTFCLLPLCLCGAASRAPAPAPRSVAIANFAKVSDHLYRGAQPDSAGFAALRSLGIRTVISLRTPDEVGTSEAKVARASGIDFIQVPIVSGHPPTDEQVAQVFAAIANSSGPVYVHCQHGADRTGVVVACYRIEKDGWTVAQAIDEADRYGLKKTYAEMRDYVLAYAQRHMAQNLAGILPKTVQGQATPPAPASPAP